MSILEKIFAFIVAVGILVALFLWTDHAFHPNTTKVIEKQEIVSTIDSVWFTSPGQENTLQTDYRYYGKASNGQIIVSTDKAFHVGDLIVCIYYRYENIKTEKK